MSRIAPEVNVWSSKSEPGISNLCLLYWHGLLCSKKDELCFLATGERLILGSRHGSIRPRCVDILTWQRLTATTHQLLWRRQCTVIGHGVQKPNSQRRVAASSACNAHAGTCTVNHVNAIDVARACFETKDKLQCSVFALPCRRQNDAISAVLVTRTSHAALSVRTRHWRVTGELLTNRLKTDCSRNWKRQAHDSARRH